MKLSDLTYSLYRNCTVSNNKSQIKVCLHELFLCPLLKTSVHVHYSVQFHANSFLSSLDNADLWGNRETQKFQNVGGVHDSYLTPPTSNMKSQHEAARTTFFCSLHRLATDHSTKRVISHCCRTDDTSQNNCPLHIICALNQRDRESEVGME